jgi:transcriptional regulator with XRE-family HTH domain
MGKLRKRRRPHLEIDQQVGARIRQLRLSLGMSQSTLANVLRLTFQQIQKYENGTNAVATTRLPDLCKALSITPNDLYEPGGRANDSDRPPLHELSTRAMKLALTIDRLPANIRVTIAKFIAALADGK